MAATWGYLPVYLPRADHAPDPHTYEAYAHRMGRLDGLIVRPDVARLALVTLGNDLVASTVYPPEGIAVDLFNAVASVVQPAWIPGLRLRVVLHVPTFRGLYPPIQVVALARVDMGAT